jgi:hypothetical protein
LLGDNAYESGTDAEYQTNFFDIYKDKALQQFVLWPAPGNHDYANGDPNRQNDHLIPYYDIFSVPTKGEAGGFPSYKKAYYSFDYANIHFISLDSYGNENAKRLYDTTGAQVAWLKKDLETNKLPWVIAYWHHPPYTMSSHNSDTEPELVQLRTDFIKMLERYNIDLVLCGHSHDYERSYLMKGHYGPEATFDSTIHRLSTSSAKYNGSPNSCPYLKSEPTQTKGTVYVVAGSAGKVGGYQAEYPHNAMYYSDVTHGGSMYLEITGNRLDAKFLCADGVIRDHFSMLKEVNKTSKISTTKGENVTLTASWTGNYVWSPGGERTKSISINAQNNASYSVSDSLNCLLDKFEITINTTSINIDETLPAINRDRLFVLKKDSNHEVYIFNKSIKAFVYDTNGKQVSSINNSKQLNTSNLPNGTYFVQTDSNERLKISIFR